MNNLKGKYKYIFIDADDTLWENESYFRDAEVKFAELLAEYTTPKGVQELLWAKQEENIPLFGYGSKTYMIGMVDAALELCGGSTPAHIYKGIKKIIIDLAFHDLDIVDGVEDTLKVLSKDYILIVATKGDLVEQLNKFRVSGLAKYFHHIEVMEHKNEQNYLELISKHDLNPEELLMIGNSVKSDIAPVVNIGGRAIYIQHETSWDHEYMELPESDRIVEVEKIEDVLNFL